MKYLIPVLFLFAYAMPLPAHAAGAADMSCVKGDCKKTDPAKEAEKEMNKAAGTEIPIEAPVEAAAPVTPNPVTPMQAAEAIKEIEQAIEKETVEKSIAPRTGAGSSSGSVALSPSTQSPSCAPFAAQQDAVRAKVTGFVEQHQLEQKAVSDKIAEGVTLHQQEQARISQIVADGAAEHQAQQPVEGAKSADYQRQLAEEGLAIRDKLAANVLQHQQEQPALRCLTEETFATYRDRLMK